MDVQYALLGESIPKNENKNDAGRYSVSINRWHTGKSVPPSGVVAELVDAAVSKSASILEYGFESHLPHSYYFTEISVSSHSEAKQ